MTLKAVRRSSRFEGAPAQYMNAALLDDGSDCIDLLFIFNSAGTRHHHHIASADFDLLLPWTNLDSGSFGLEWAARKLVRRRDLDDLAYTIQDFDFGGIHRLAANDTKYGAGSAGGTVHVEADLDKAIDHLLNLFFLRSFLHHDNHISTSPIRYA